MSEILPGSAVALFRLPLPVTALPYINDTIERVYGTGDTMIRPDGDSFQIIAPKDGFGPIKKGGRRPTRPTDEDMKLKYQQLRNGELKLTVEDATDSAKVVMAMMRQWFDMVGGVNYVEAGVTWPDEEGEFVFILQRRAGETPHALREKAEARVAELEAKLAEFKSAETKSTV